MTVPVAQNSFLEAPIPKLYLTTATPMLLIMATSGFMTLADAWFLGTYVGADALTAVTLMFPPFMMLVAMMTLVGNGMASRLARARGAGDMTAANSIFTAAHGLALTMCLLTALVFLVGGDALVLGMARNDHALAGMGYVYLAILVAGTPISFLLSVHLDALRTEGRAGGAALITVFASLANLALNYLLIVEFSLGVAGSALGTVAAQGLALGLAIILRVRRRNGLSSLTAKPADWMSGWARIIALGAPQSLSFLGISLGSAAIIYSLQTWSGDQYPVIVAAYGIMTRIMTFLYLPMMAVALAMQTITGNNLGASAHKRVDASLRFALVLIGTYCVTMEVTVFLARNWIGSVFVDDVAVINEVARIAPFLLLLYPVAGLSIILASHFQASGEASRAAFLALPKAYLFSIPLVLLLPVVFGEKGIWYAMPMGDIGMVFIGAAVLFFSARKTGRRFGLFLTKQA